MERFAHVRMKIGAGVFVAYFAELCLRYPIWNRMRYFNFPISYTVLQYLLMAGVVALVALVLVPVVVSVLTRDSLFNMVVLSCVMTWVILCVVAYVIGTLPGPVADRVLIHGPFFSEWQFIPFALIDAGILSLISIPYFAYGHWAGKRSAS